MNTKNTIKVKPILVESEKTPEIGDICKNSIQLFIWTSQHAKQNVLNTLTEYKSTKVKQLILVSLNPDDKIEIGDLTIDLNCKDKHKGLCTIDNDIELERYAKNTKFKIVKVIATQEQLSPEYIQQFINEYNKDEVKDIEIEMEQWTEFSGDNHNTPTISKPKLTNGFVNIVYSTNIYKEPYKLDDNWETILAIKNIPYLPHIINSLKELRRYYIDGIQKGYDVRKLEEATLYTEKEVILLCQKAFEDSCKYSSFKDFIEENFNNNKNK